MNYQTGESGGRAYAKCVSCGEEIDHLVNVRPVLGHYKVSIDKDGDEQYEQFASEEIGDNKWYCPKCEKQLPLDDETAIALLKGERDEDSKTV